MRGNVKIEVEWFLIGRKRNRIFLDFDAQSRKWVCSPFHNTPVVKLSFKVIPGIGSAQVGGEPVSENVINVVTIVDEVKNEKNFNDYFKCIYFLLSRAPLGQSHYLAPVALGFLIMRKIFLVGNLFLLMCPSQCWSEHTAFYSMCGTVLPSANGVHQAW